MLLLPLYKACICCCSQSRYCGESCGKSFFPFSNFSHFCKFHATFLEYIPLHFLQVHEEMILDLQLTVSTFSILLLVQKLSSPVALLKANCSKQWCQYFKLCRQYIQCFSIIWARITSFISKYNYTTINMPYSSCMRYLRESVNF